MAADRKEYQPLCQHVYEDGIDQSNRPIRQVSPATRLATNALIVVAILSSLGNVLWALQAIRASSAKTPNDGRSLYAGLERDVPTPYRDDTIFASHNRTIADAAWDSWVVDPGIVALPHDWVKAKMLPQAQHWPWDKNKGIYLLNGFHNIHCLQLIRKSLLQAADGKPLTNGRGNALEHNLHCIESLRQDTLCNADDTPRYSGYSKKEVSGVMQTRMCRSWDKLEAWARDHTACFRDIGRDVENFPQIEKYKFCPDGYEFSATGSPIPPWVTGSGVSHPGDE